MDFNLILFCLYGGLVSADRDAAIQMMISQPLVACSVAGAILGNLEIGLITGLLLQLPYLVEIPAGAAKTSLGNLAAFVAAGVAITLTARFPELGDTALLLAIVFGVILSWVSTPLLRLMRYLNLLLVRRMDDAAKLGNLGRITRLQSVGVLNAYAFGVIFSGIFIIIGMGCLTSFIQLIPKNFELSVNVFRPVLFGAGIGAMAWLFVKKTTWLHAIFGASLSLLLLFLKG